MTGVTGLSTLPDHPQSLRQVQVPPSISVTGADTYFDFSSADGWFDTSFDESSGNTISVTHSV
ncbi:unnamed protein product [Rhodiola kirilowii]